MLALLLSVAWAEEPAPSETSAEPAVETAETVVEAAEEILLVPEGSTFTVDSVLYQVPSKYWLLPDKHYRSAIVQAKKLNVCQPALDQCVESTLEWQDRTYTALQTCSDQFGEDELLVQDLTGQVQTLETRALIAENNAQRARRNSFTAWGITGGLLVGAVVAVLVIP
jgi:hypothetical protein